MKDMMEDIDQILVVERSKVRINLMKYLGLGVISIATFMLSMEFLFFQNITSVIPKFIGFILGIYCYGVLVLEEIICFPTYISDSSLEKFLLLKVESKNGFEEIKNELNEFGFVSMSTVEDFVLLERKTRVRNRAMNEIKMAFLEK